MYALLLTGNSTSSNSTSSPLLCTLFLFPSRCASYLLFMSIRSLLLEPLSYKTTLVSILFRSTVCPPGSSANTTPYIFSLQLRAHVVSWDERQGFRGGREVKWHCSSRKSPKGVLLVLLTSPARALYYLSCDMPPSALPFFHFHFQTSRSVGCRQCLCRSWRAFHVEIEPVIKKNELVADDPLENSCSSNFADLGL